MYPEYSDTRIYADLANLNRGFLDLLVEPGSPRVASTFGLDAAIVNQLRQLSAVELDMIATTPGLLACFSQFAPVPLHQVAETSIAGLSEPPVWRESARLFVMCLLTYLRHMQQHGWSRCALGTGFGSASNARVPPAHFDFARIRPSADLAVDQLRARFAAHPSFWSDLIHSARSGNEDFQTLSRLTIIPLVVAEECSARE